VIHIQPFDIKSYGLKHGYSDFRMGFITRRVHILYLNGGLGTKRLLDAARKYLTALLSSRLNHSQ